MPLITGLFQVLKLIDRHATEFIKVSSDCFENAAKSGHVEILEWLLQKKKERKEKKSTNEAGKLCIPDDVDVNKLLHKVCNKGHLKMAEKLIQLGANVNNIQLLETYSHTNPLHSACATRKKNEEMVKFLLERGAYVDGRTEPMEDIMGPRRRLPIEIAMDNNQTETVKVLLKHGAEVKYLTNLLEQAAKAPGDDIELVEMLLQRSYQMGIDQGGTRAICYAVQSSNERVVQVLLHHGIQVLLSLLVFIYF